MADVTEVVAKELGLETIGRKKDANILVTQENMNKLWTALLTARRRVEELEMAGRKVVDAAPATSLNPDVILALAIAELRKLLEGK